jgi:hypothetical protein
LKVKIFLWLDFKRRHWTADRQAHHGLEVRADCFLCDQAPYTFDHLLYECPFARDIWFFICQAIGIILPPSALLVRQWWRRLRRATTPDKRRSLDSLFALTSWELWKERNARCFRQASSTVPQLLQVIKAQADLWGVGGS